MCAALLVCWAKRSGKDKLRATEAFSLLIRLEGEVTFRNGQMVNPWVLRCWSVEKKYKAGSMVLCIGKLFVPVK
jgi:hypothetical protein